MYTIQDVKIRRITEMNGAPCAEVEVYPATEGDSVLLAYLTPSAPLGGYELVKLVRSDASLEVDWYDNSMHSAYEDATDEAFENSTTATAEENRDAFKQQLLSFGQLYEQLNQRLSEGTNWM
ncbi:MULTISPECIES: hypothetical protein [Paenibacillus]|uniref:Uncharacterized protein n=1 Tax=Paenibacillus campinasensis TaxID=66347 RepID=A0A268ELJ4_9BACL|nr:MULTISPECIES: hypothetical protein [Paenibacillus]MUG67745.1 hypothetical protein [Paenibacillus campinasensis]PAD73985.1 hypothetical protein CHH67_19335 [Paenibacillus campinasensis]PAK48826.1 hypothetical protein CHH75_21750 [Paenibacillus sp. 7541]